MFVNHHNRAALSKGATTVHRLVVAPHADDEALGCGGVLAKYPETSSVVVVAKPDTSREQEFFRAKSVLGYKDSYFLDLPDGAVGDDMRRFVGSLDELLNELQPEELYLPAPSIHQDHVAAYEAGMRAARLSMTSGHWFPPTVLVYDVAAYDLSLYPTHLTWNVFEALSEPHIDQKAQAVEAYTSQQVSGPHPANGIKLGAAALGAARRVPWAEQFALVRSVKTALIRAGAADHAPYTENMALIDDAMSEATA